MDSGIKCVIEAVIFAADTPVSVERLVSILEGHDKAEVKDALENLVADYKAKAGGIFIDEVAGGYVFRTNTEYAPWIRRLFKIGQQKLSKPAMESLAIIAYKQPLTRSELESVRGVDSGGVLGTLMDKRFIKIAGRKEIPGRPVVYGTTREFLETFDLKDLSCLPSLRQLQTTEGEDASETNRQRTEETEDGTGRIDEGSQAHLAGGGDVAEEGRGADDRGEGAGQRSGGDGAGGEG
ncbi:MAG: SMC-Scp complex subunit ScpB [Deltaproteobacteria bacterium RIFCSPLOWO2_02_FULL_53_8]|nr:MAG: SMC-Scp complex subunit ScpB [Deltaproteobacteria bacterium RIFCSPLOWO2_02_FULL_53_8]